MGAELSEREATLFDAFLEVCRSRRNEDNQDEAPNPYALANKCDISLAKLSKCSSLCAALWTAYFSFFAKDLVLGMGNKLKYDSLETFLNAYEPHFVDPMHYGEKEQISLCHMANLCSVVLKFMSAKGSKQLFMKLAPRLLEGWDVKYICGSGQSRATADRVLIYEKEGAVEPLRRAPRRNFVEEPQGHQHSSTAHSAKKSGLLWRKKWKPLNLLALTLVSTLLKASPATTFGVNLMIYRYCKSRSSLRWHLNRTMHKSYPILFLC